LLSRAIVPSRVSALKSGTIARIDLPHHTGDCVMSTPAATLQGRLLCASACAYAVRPGDNVLDPSAAAPYYDGVGYRQPPAAFFAGDRDINSCLVGTTADGVVVAFRGTLPLDGPFNLPLLFDWVNDLNARPVAGDGLPGQVHEGFLGSLDSLWENVADEVSRQLAAGAATALFVTGHSKGGGLAALAAMRFSTQKGLAPQVFTYAAPKAGNKAFADAYNAVIDHTRYEYADDVVPHLPPSGALFAVLAQVSFFQHRLSGLAQFDYERVGKLMYIRQDLAVVPDPAESLLPERRARLIQLILTGHIQEIGDDHRSGCGYGYMSALCPDGVCPQSQS
jgi:hypothetical protein